jgi:hypothetical protein
MSEKPATALLRVKWPAGKKLIVTHITAMDEDGRPVTLKVLSVAPEYSRQVSTNPEAWQEGFAAGRRGLTRKANPYDRHTPPHRRQVLAGRVRRRPARPLTQIEPISPRRKCRCMARRLH